MQKKILSAGHNFALLRVRNTLLEQAGHHVTTTREIQLIPELIRKDHFSAVVICSSVPMHLREILAQEVKRSKPAVPLVVICAHEKELDHFRRLAEETVLAALGISQALLEAVTRVAGQPVAGPKAVP